MSSNPYTGLTAAIKIGNPKETLVYAAGADLTLEKDIIEILAFGQTFKEKVPAIRDWSLSIDGTAALASGNTQEELYDAFENATLLEVGIYLDDHHYFEGAGYVENFNIDAAPDDKINLSASISGTGALVLELHDLTVEAETDPPDGVVGVAYTDYTFTAVGGAEPYEWDKSQGMLPPGLELSSGGVLSGEPTEEGEYTFQVRVTDDDDVSATRTVTITVTD